ncbi:hypothetical protein OAE14_02690 [Alphaproteobacteria bacterium]|jgi:hypothetical protein|nr:hypothetical protein [Alphaproteobacteria bacterium]|tara:strand:- start:126 stop:332 length:207 start_codon:yes stop_codon:yes gene_type:complete
MKPGNILYLISNLDIYAEILDEKVMNNIPHFNIIVHRGTSTTKSFLSKKALETFYQSSSIPKKSFFNY